MLAALAARVSAVGFGKGSLTFHVDEDFNIPLALRMSWGSPDPHYFQYPALLWDLLFGIDQLAFWIAKQYGVVASWSAFGQQFQQTPVPFFLLGRTVSVLAGTAAVATLYLLGRRLFSPEHGLLAAVFLAGTFLHIRDSALATPDALTSFCVILALLGAAGVLRQGRWRDYVLAGVGTGLAASAKYNAAVVVVAIAVAHMLSGTRGRASRLGAAILLAGLVFLALNPYLLLDQRRAVEDLRALAVRVRDGQCMGGCLDVGLGWWYHLALSLRYGMGLVLLGLTLIGILLAIMRRDASGWVLLSFAAPFYGGFGPTRLVFARYMTPLLPVLCLLAACGAWSLAGWFSRPRLRSAAVLGLACVALIEPLGATSAYIKMIRRSDTRVEAYKFLGRLPPGTRVVSYGPHEVWISTSPRLDVEMVPKRGDETWAGYVARLRADGVDYILVHHSALEVFSPAVPGLDRALRASALLAREISPYAPGATPAPVYDWLDPHYFPMGHFRGIRRSGPLIRIYRLR